MEEIQMSPLWDNIIRLRVLLGRFHMLGLWVGEECCLRANFRPSGMELREVLGAAVELGLAKRKILASGTELWNFHTKGEPMRESDIELVDKLSGIFGAGEPIDAKSAHKRTQLGKVDDWADRLYVLSSSGLLRLRSQGVLADGRDAEYGLMAYKRAQLDSEGLARAQKVHAKSNAIAATLRQMIAAFGERHFTFKEAKELTGQATGTIIAANSLAQRRGWMSMGAASRYRFYPEKIPPELKGETIEVASAGKNQGKSPKVQASQFRTAIRLLIKLYWGVVEFRIKDIAESPAFRAFDALDAGEFMDEAEDKGFVVNLDPGRDRRRRFRIHRENRKVQEIAMAVSVIPGEEKLDELMAAINSDSDFVGVLLLELERLSATRQADDGWVRITNGVAEAVRSLYGWRKEDAHDLLLELVLDRIAAANRERLEVQKLEDGVRIFRSRVVVIEPEVELEPVPAPAPVAEPEPVEPPPVAEPESRTVTIEDLAVEAAGVITASLNEVSEPEPEEERTVSQVRAPSDSSPATGVTFTALAQIKGVQLFILSLMFEKWGLDWAPSPDIRDEIVEFDGWEEANFQGLGRLFMNLRLAELLDGRGEGENREYRVARKGAVEILGLDETEHYGPRPEPLPASVPEPEPELAPQQPPPPELPEAIPEGPVKEISQMTVNPAPESLPLLTETETVAALQAEEAELAARLATVRRRRELLEFAIESAHNIRCAIGGKAETSDEFEFVKDAFLRHLAAATIPILEQ